MYTEKEKQSYYCEKCKRVLKGTEFYYSHSPKYADNNGKLRVCKQCATMHIDNWDPDTYLPLLEEMDIPYIPSEWNKLMQKYAVGVPPEKLSGTSILGRYSAKMRLQQFSKYRWKDNDAIVQLEKDRIRTTMVSQGYDEVEIQQALNNPGLVVEAPPKPEFDSESSGSTGDAFADPDVMYKRNVEKAIQELNLTQDDINYLTIKWGKLYQPEEWLQLEKLYTDMEASYDIQTAGHIDTLKLICKTSLKANQLIDLGDIDGYQKISRVYDTLMKAGRFTASQMKETGEDQMDSISALVALCESEGFIPRFYIDKPNDKVDETLKDLQNYTHSLIFNEMNLGNMIENAMKAMVKEEEKEEDDDFEEEELNYDNLDVKDFLDFAETIEEDEDEDIEALLKQMRGED